MAITTFSGTVSIAIEAQFAKAIGDTTFGENRARFGYGTVAEFTAAGAGANAANQIWADERELAASTSETLDLAGSLTNAFNETVTFARIKAVIIERIANADASTEGSSITVGNAASNQWVGPFGAVDETQTIRAGGAWAVICDDATGYTVTAGSADNLKIANNDATNKSTYRITLIGATS